MKPRLLSQSAAIGYLVTALATAFATACGISSSTEGVFSANEQGASGGSSGTGGGAGGSAPNSSSSTTSSSASTTSSTTSSSGGGGSVVSVSCNTTPCAPGEVCCFDSINPSQSACSAPRTCPNNTIELACNGPADCPGKVCCGDMLPLTQAYTRLSCQPTCNGATQRLQCEGDESVCPPGTSCFESNILGPGYSYCQ